MHIDEELFKKDRFKRNLKQYEEAMKEGRTVFMDIDDLTDIIDYYNYDGLVDDANNVADYALALYPGSIGPLVFKTRQALVENNYEKARDLCEQIEDKSDVDYFYLRAELLIAEGKTQEAEDLLLARYEETDRDEHDNFCLDVGALYIDYGYSTPARQWLERMRDWDNNERLEIIARVHTNAGEYEDATECLERLIDHNPFVSRFWNMLALIQLCNGEYPECLSSAEYSLAITPNNSDGLWCKAKALLGMNETEGALEYYRRFLERIPDNARAEADMGSCYLQLSNLERARECLLLAETHADCSDNMLMVQIYDDLAYVYSCMQQLEKALYYLGKAEDYENEDNLPGHDPNRIVLVGHIYLQNHQKDKAIELFDQAIEMSEENPEVMLKVCVSLYDQGEYETSIAYFRHLETNMPKGWKFGFSYMAGSLLKTRQLNEGVEYLKKACLLNSREVKLVFGDMFPAGMPCEDYYDYIKNVKF